jgi:hypothetical protein
MSTARMLLLAVQGAVFLLWATLMFRALFGIRRRSQPVDGRAWLGPLEVIGAYRDYLSDPAHRAERRRLLSVTLLLLGLTLLTGLLPLP